MNITTTWKSPYPEIEYLGFKFVVDPKFKWIAVDSDGSIHVWANKPVPKLYDNSTFPGEWNYGEDDMSNDLHRVGYLSDLLCINEILIVDDWETSLLEINQPSNLESSMKIHEDNNRVVVEHLSKSNPGHNYGISVAVADDLAPITLAGINFQNGPVKQQGVNGITSESLLAILIHRTEILNQNFPCAENLDALVGLKSALAAFESRTKDRIKRQVEGQNLL